MDYKRTIRCVVCDIFIGEIDFDAQVVLPKCGHCANPILEIVDSLPILSGKIEDKTPLLLVN
ncbi:MAG: hypothetical protein ACT4N5_04405 [Nitrosopumilaceae archaeon]